MSSYISSTISVYRKEYLDCKEMEKFLKSFNIKTLITSHYSLIPHKKYGCKLTQSISSKNDIENIWNPINKKYNFNYAYLKVDNIYNGCIFDYLEKLIIITNMKKKFYFFILFFNKFDLLIKKFINKYDRTIYTSNYNNYCIILYYYLYLFYKKKECNS